MSRSVSTIKLDRNAKDNLRLTIECVLEQYLQTFAPGDPHAYAVLWRQHGYVKRVFFPVVVKPRKKRLTDKKQLQFRNHYTRYANLVSKLPPKDNYSTLNHSNQENHEYPALLYFLYPNHRDRTELRFESQGRKSASSDKRDKLHLAVSIFTQKKRNHITKAMSIQAHQWLKQLEHAVDAWDNAEILWLSHMSPDGDPTDFDGDEKKAVLTAMLTEVIDYACDRDPSPPFSSPLWWMAAQYAGVDSQVALNPLFLSATFSSESHQSNSVPLTDYSEKSYSDIVSALTSMPLHNYDLLKLPGNHIVFRCNASVPEGKLKDIAGQLGYSYEEGMFQEERAGGRLALRGGVADMHYAETAKRVLEETATAAGRSFTAFEQASAASDLEKKLHQLLWEMQSMTAQDFRNTVYHDPQSWSDDQAKAHINRANELHKILIAKMCECLQFKPPASSSQIGDSDTVRQTCLSFKVMQSCEVCGTYLLRMWICLLRHEDPSLVFSQLKSDFPFYIALPEGVEIHHLLNTLKAVNTNQIALTLDRTLMRWKIEIGLSADKSSGLGILSHGLNYRLHGGQLNQSMKPWLKVIAEGRAFDEFKLEILGKFSRQWDQNQVKLTLSGRLGRHSNAHDAGAPPSPSSPSDSPPTATPESPPEEPDSPSGPEKPPQPAVYVIDWTYSATTGAATREWPSDWHKFKTFAEFRQGIRNTPPHVLVCHIDDEMEQKKCLNHKADDSNCKFLYLVTGGGPIDPNQQGVQPYGLSPKEGNDAAKAMNTFRAEVHRVLYNGKK